MFPASIASSVIMPNGRLGPPNACAASVLAESFRGVGLSRLALQTAQDGAMQDFLQAEGLLSSPAAAATLAEMTANRLNVPLATVLKALGQTEVPMEHALPPAYSRLPLPGQTTLAGGPPPG
jgi:hypothetical protein